LETLKDFDMSKKHKHTTDDPNKTGGVTASEAVDENEDGVDDESGQHIEPPTAVTSPPPPTEGGGPSAEDHARNEHAPHGSTAMLEGTGEYHPNPDMANTNAGAPQNSAPYLDNDTHDFGPNGGEERCLVCGRTRAELGEKVGKPLTEAELEHPDVKDTNLLPPRLR